MKVHHFLAVGITMCVVACAVGMGDTMPVVEEKKIGNDSPTSYPPPNLNKTEEPKNNSDFWDCGTEIIESEGPDGRIILMEIPLNCEPIQDFYQGCPVESEFEVVEEK